MVVPVLMTSCQVSLIAEHRSGHAPETTIVERQRGNVIGLPARCAVFWANDGKPTCRARILLATATCCSVLGESADAVGGVCICGGLDDAAWLRRLHLRRAAVRSARTRPGTIRNLGVSWSVRIAALTQGKMLVGLVPRRAGRRSARLGGIASIASKSPGSSSRVRRDCCIG